jgi:N-acetylglucosamine-6-phosphate deacetylase
MLDAVNRMRSLGFSDPDVSRMSSLNPAKLLGIQNSHGSIEIGKRADLVGLDSDGIAKLTVIAGQVVFDGR